MKPPIILTKRISLRIIPIELINEMNLTEEELLEQEANYFAMSLLMPEKLVKIAWEELSKDLSYCAKVFGVSNELMFYRLQSLDLI